MTSEVVEIGEGIDRAYVDDALRLSYEAFARKFRIGFRNADDLVRLFRGSVDTTSCLSATLNGRLLGILTFQAEGREFYRLKPTNVLTRFWPLRAALVVLNLVLLDDDAGPDGFVIDSLAVDPASRGMGIGTAMMLKAEEKAGLMGKRTMALGVIGENAGAIRLYERLGYRATRAWRGTLLRLFFGTREVRRMEKPLAAR